jgi:rare lipoprotein A
MPPGPRFRAPFGALLGLAIACAVCPHPALASTPVIAQEGIASWYGARWAGHRTAAGTRFNPDAMTAASATLPLGARVLVRLEGTARSVLVTITDRLGAVDRIIDLSRAAARKIGMLTRGTARVVLIRL